MSPESTANAFRRDDGESVKKKKKRKREENGDQDSSTRTEPDARKKKKKKKSHVGSPAASTEETTENRPSSQTSEPEPGEDPHFDPSASTANLLAAIVAAATGVQPNIPQDDFLNGGQFPDYPTSPSAPGPAFPDINNVLLPDAVIGSNELVLRALQDLDVSKLANVLRTLEEAANAANAPLPQHILQALPAPLNQRPASSDVILSLAENKIPTTGTKIPNENPVEFTSEDHAHILATKWLESKKLNELAQTQGVFCSWIQTKLP